MKSDAMLWIRWASLPLAAVIISTLVPPAWAQPDNPAKSQGEAKSLTLEQRLDGALEGINNYIAATLFQDLAFGAFKYQLVDKNGVPKVTDKNEPEMDGPEVPFVVVVLVGGSIFFTFWYGWINVRGLKHALTVIRGKYDNPADQGEISHFQALTSALSATIGLGNIAGVALAVTLGGPGAVFWMILLALFGMTAKFNECSLSQFYRKTNPDGSISGGPMYYLDMGLREKGRVLAPIGKILAVIFALMCIGGALGGGNMFQANQSFEAFADAFNIPLTRVDEATGTTVANPWPARGYGIIMAGLVAAVIIGGIKRIGAATSRIVPSMCLLYVIASLTIIIGNIDMVPSIIARIFREAFTAEATYGGFVGVMIWGFKRAAFSNEAGLGSAAIAHSAAKTNEPIREGLVAMVGPFIDTIIICMMTALVVLITDAYVDPRLTIADDPEKILQGRITAVEHTGQVATAVVALGRRHGVVLDTKFLIQRRGKTVGSIKMIDINDYDSKGHVKLEAREQTDEQKAEHHAQEYVNLPSVGDVAVHGELLIKDKPDGLIQSRITEVQGDTITFDVGFQDKVTKRMTFYMHRRGQYLGTATITDVNQIACVAKVNSGSWTPEEGDLALSGRTVKGAAVTTHAFRSLAPWFPIILSICIILFAYSTMISWCYYAERAWTYLFGHKSLIVFQIIFVIFVFIGSVIKLGNVLNFSDLMILCMAFPNIVGSLFLIGMVRRKLDDYWSRYKLGDMKPTDATVNSKI